MNAGWLNLLTTVASSTPKRGEEDPPAMIGWYVVICVVGVAALLWGAG